MLTKRYPTTLVPFEIVFRAKLRLQPRFGRGLLKAARTAGEAQAGDADETVFSDIVLIIENKRAPLRVPM